MLKNPRHRLNRRAFSLLELLVTVAIVSIIASLFLSLGSKALTTANMMRATSQMRAIGAAFSLYASENGGVYPIPWNIDGGQMTAASSEVHWADSLSSGMYLGKPTQYVHQALVSPGVVYKRADGSKWHSKEMKITYNVTLATCAILQNNNVSIYAGRPIHKVDNPANTYILYQGKQRKQMDGYSNVRPTTIMQMQSDIAKKSNDEMNYIDLPYNNTGLFLRADGSVVPLDMIGIKSITEAQWVGIAQ